MEALSNLINSLDSGIAKVLLILFTGFSLFVIGEFSKSLKGTLKDHEKKIDLISKEMGADISSIGKTLSDYQLEFQKESSGLRLEIKNATNTINNNLNNTKIEVARINEALKNLNDSVIQYRKSLGADYLKIRRFERGINKNTEDIKELKNQYGKIVLLAGSNKKMINKHNLTVTKVEDIFNRKKKKKV